MLLLSLPDELLIFILRYVRGCSTLNEGFKILRACKKLRELGQGTIMEHVKFSNDNILPFLWTIKATHILFTGTMTLTIDLILDWPQLDLLHNFSTSFPHLVEQRWDRHYDTGPCSNGCLEWSISSSLPSESKTTQRLNALVEALPLLSSLQAFALIIDREPSARKWCRCIIAPKPEVDIGSILNALPSSCRSVYLDTGGADEVYDIAAFTDVLRKRRLILQNLWLRLFSDVSGAFVHNDGLNRPELHEVESVAFQMWLSDRVGILDESDWQRDGQDLWDLPEERRICFQKWKLASMEVALVRVPLQVMLDYANSEGIHGPSKNTNRSVTITNEHQPPPLTWPQLTSITIDTCLCPMRQSESLTQKTENLHVLAQDFAQNANCFPKLDKCIIIQSQLDPLFSTE